jgi:hypothetical protein
MDAVRFLFLMVQWCGYAIGTGLAFRMQHSRGFNGEATA